MVETVAVAKEVAAKVPVGLCQGRHQRLVPASMEKMATYIGTKYGDEAAQE